MGKPKNCMRTGDEEIMAELPAIKSIVGLARKLEEAERGGSVSLHDPEVQLRAAEIILGGVGESLRGVLEGPT